MITDIKITDTGDILCDRDGIPILISDLDAVSQDIKHMIWESGLLVELVAERSASLRRSIHNKLIVLVESDLRIIPGTCAVSEITSREFELNAVADQGTFTLSFGDFHG